MYGMSYDEYFKRTCPTYEEMVKILWRAIHQLPPDRTTHYEPSASVKAQYPPVSPEGVWLGKEIVDRGVHSLQVNSLQLPGHSVLRSSQENKTSSNLCFSPYPKSPFLWGRVPHISSSCAGASSHNSDVGYAFLGIERNNRRAELFHCIDTGDMQAFRPYDTTKPACGRRSLNTLEKGKQLLRIALLPLHTKQSDCYLLCTSFHYAVVQVHTYLISSLLNKSLWALVVSIGCGGTELLRRWRSTRQ